MLRYKNKYNMRVFKQLKKFYGFNWFQIFYIYKIFGFNLSKLTIDLEDERKYLKKILNFLNIFYIFGSKLKRKEYLNFQQKKKMGLISVKYLLLGKPVRGQRTKTNARTAKKRISIYFNKENEEG